VGKEIERRFLVKDGLTFDAWNKISICQGYFPCSNPSIRIRISMPNSPSLLASTGTGTITIKSKDTGFTKHEFEYQVPPKEAEEILLLYCDKRIITKNRHLIKLGNHIWEVDEFTGLNYGLTIAEVELSSENEEIEMPDWIDEEITGISKYSNHSLALKNEKTWKNS